MSKNFDSKLFRKNIVFSDKLTKVTMVAEFSDNIGVIGSLVEIKHLETIGIIKLFHHINFVSE